MNFGPHSQPIATAHQQFCMTWTNREGLDTCDEHDNWFVDKENKLEIDPDIQQVIDNAAITQGIRVGASLTGAL